MEQSAIILEEMDKIALLVTTRESASGVLAVHSHIDSKASALIQLADFVAGALSYKYNLGGTGHRETIKQGIREEMGEVKAGIKKNSDLWAPILTVPPWRG